MDLKKYIAKVADFPKKGIIFRDITPLINDGKAYAYAINEIKKYAEKKETQLIVGPEARGFIFGCPVAGMLNIGFAPVRKPNKLPRETLCVNYDLEYGSNTLCIHKDAIKKGQRVLIIDDLLATGGTINATINLIEKTGGIVVGVAFLAELPGLNGKENLKDIDYISLVKY